MSKITLSRHDLEQAASHAHLSSHVYFREPTKPPRDGWEVMHTSDELMPGKRGFFGALYSRDNPKTGAKEYAVAFRGTDGDDMKSNFAIAVGALPSQFKDALAFTKLAAEKTGIDVQHITLTGHSLGGYLARTVARVLDVKKVYAFSSPGPSAETRAALEKLAPSALPNDKIIHIRSKHDIIGLWGSDEKIVLDLDTSGQHHAINKLRNHLSNMLQGPNAPQIPLNRNVGFLEKIFNVVSKPLASGLRLMKSIQKLGQHRPPQPPRPGLTMAAPAAA
ncbi:MAG: DUF2974 domain-containing protein [Bdellovibrionales bacterium]|jgi:dipeptidyl aminopeptidase/acylaminoacyl peptidase|nr:DUF2974 domain-containing protein [Bdellovibrionales bacterium]